MRRHPDFLGTDQGGGAKVEGIVRSRTRIQKEFCLLLLTTLNIKPQTLRGILQAWAG